MSLDIGFASQTPSLPAAGGAGGLGETFAPDLSTGTGTLAVPLGLPNGPNDSSPKLALRYDSGTPNGPLGLGWSLALPRLIRSTMVGRPRYDDSDTLVLDGSGPLVRMPDGSLRPQVETGEWRIDASGDGYVATDRAGTRFHLGVTPDSRITGAGGGTWAWLLHQIEDNLGELTTFTWRTSDAQRYLDTATWGPFALHFGYEPRPDVLRWGRGGFLLRTEERCSSIELHLPAQAPSLVRRWSLGYTASPLNGASLLTTIALTGFAADGTSLTAPPLRLGYTEAAAPTLRRVDPEDDRAAPPALDATGRVELVDWTGTGTADVVEFGPGGATRVWPNHAGRFGRPQSAGVVAALAGPQSRSGLIDVDGDGLADVVRADVPLTRYQPRTVEGFSRPITLRDAPSVAPGSPSARLADFDGDGRVGLLWSTGRSLVLAHRSADGGWLGQPDVVPARPDGPPADLTDPRVFCADMTGDGTPDVVRVDGSGVTYWPYLGNGIFGDRVSMAGAPRLPGDCDPASVLVVDLDGDGCADVLHLDRGTLTWWPNRSGCGFEAPRVVEHLPTGAMSTVRVADLLGTGTPALCWTATLASGRGRWFALDLLGGISTSLLTRIDNGVGRTTVIGWSTSAREGERDRAAGSAWTTRLPMVLPVVASVSVTDATTGPVGLTRYRYHDGRYDGALREVCGFGRVTTEEVGDANTPTLVTNRWFNVGVAADGAEPGTTGERVRARAVRGRLLRQDRVDLDGHLFDRFEQEWRVDATNGSTVTPRLVASTRSVFEAQVDAVSRIVTEQLAWDADGNVTQARESSYTGADPVPTQQLLTDTTYAHDAAGRFRQRVSRIVQHDGAGALLSDLRTFYDGLPEGQVGGSGLVTERHALAVTDAQATAVYGAELPDFGAQGYIRKGGSDGWWIPLGRYQRSIDAQGLRGTVVGPGGGTTTLQFDATQCYPVRVTDAAGNELRAEFDLRSYQATAVVDPSGARSEAAFDALARLVRVVEPGDSPGDPTRTMAYDVAALPVAVTGSLATSPGAARRVERQFVDGDGRIIEQRITDETGEIATVSTSYGMRGMTVRSYLPFRAAGTAYTAPAPDAPHTALSYDALGRALTTTRPDGTRATVRYLPGAVEERDGEQNRTDAGAAHTASFTRRVIDAAGRVVRVEQGLGGRTVTTADVYDIKGALAEHTDAVGATTRFERDLLGRTLRISRPESTQLVVLDAAGHVVETRTGTARLFRAYDAGGRPTAVRHGLPTSAPVAQFTYHDAGAPAPADAGAHTAGGRLVRVEDEGGVTVVDYDERGRLARKAMSPVGGPALTLELAHRSDDLIGRVTYPGGRIVDYGYNAVGGLVSIAGVIDAIDYDIAGRRTRVAYANGTEQVDGHDPSTGWRTSTVLSGPAGTLRQTGFQHDLAGNLTALTSADAATAWSYRYDDFYRLVSATSAGGTLDYAYDDANNLTSTSQLGAFGYGAGAAPASCLTSAGGDTFTYDDRGQLASAPWGTHTLDAEGRVRSIALSGGGSETLTYGHGGSLVRRVTVSAAGVTRDVLSPDRLLRIEDGQVVLQISDGERIVAREQAGVLTWLHVDHVGSLVLVTDAAGGEVLRLTYDPYGQVLTSNGAAVAPPQGFGTGEDVGHGLVLLGARWYAPHLGRFISPDPLVGDADDPAAWNAYAYCRCNPTSYVDPSGRSFWKVFAAIVATVAIIAVAVIVTVCTFGAAGPGAIALSVGGLSLTWGAVFAATAVGIVAGGVIGGIAAARAGGDAGDIFLGVVVGGAVGGWAAFGAAFAGVAVGGALGLTSGTVLSGAVVGGVAGTINGAAMGFAAGFAGGKNNGLKDVMLKVLVGAVTGLALGAAMGALSGVVAPKQSIGDAARGALTPDPPPAGAGGYPGATPGAAPTEINDLGAAFGKIGTAAAGRAGGVIAPYAAAALAPVAANAFVSAIVVDAGSASAAALFDDLQEYLKTHNVSLGPFDFVKSDF
ncbi:MAG: hypothetical protein QOE57_977 [Acidimicrobiaceae bacterium]|nr:hypothetical protein [Acidimicrobiaceae bacterium]